MTQPTPAQIERRYNLMNGKFGPYFFDRHNNAEMPLTIVLDRLNDTEAALTAAAQVGEPSINEKLEQWNEWYETLPSTLKAKLSINDFRRLGDNFYRIFVLQRTAAAQVGEPDGLAIRYGMQSGGDLWKATIESCAQVVKKLVDKLTDKVWDKPAKDALQEAEAAIRKLKDTP